MIAKELVHTRARGRDRGVGREPKALSGRGKAPRARYRPWTVAAAAVAAGALVAGCGSSGGNHASAGSTHTASSIPAGPIKLGVVLSLAGSYAPVGQKQQQFYQLAVDTINSQGGIAGHQIQLVVQNDQDDPAVAASAAQKLAASGVVGVLNASGPGTNEQTIPIFMKDKLPVVQPDAQAVFASNPGKYPYFFDNYPTFLTESKAMATFLQQRQQTKVGFLSDGSEFASELHTDLVASLPQGVTLGSPVTVSPTATDVSTQIEQLKSSGATTLVLGVQENFAQIYQAIEQAGWRPNILADSVITASPTSVFGPLTSLTFDACGISLASAQTKPSTQMISAIDIFVKKFGLSSVDFDFPLYLDAVDLLKAAIENTGSVDGPKLKAYLETVQNRSFSVPELSYTFTPSDHGGVKTEQICVVEPHGPDNIPIAATGAQ